MAKVSPEESEHSCVAIPLTEKPEHGSSGVQPFHRAVAPKQKSGGVPAIGVAQALIFSVLIQQKQGDVGALCRISVKELVHGLESAHRLIRIDRALAAQVRLQIGHRSNSFAGDVANHQGEPLFPKAQKIVIITTHLASLNAGARIVE